MQFRLTTYRRKILKPHRDNARQFPPIAESRKPLRRRQTSPREHTPIERIYQDREKSFDRKARDRSRQLTITVDNLLIIV